MRSRRRLCLVAVLLALVAHSACAGSLSDWWRAGRAGREQGASTTTRSGAEAWLPPGVRVIRDLAYGADPFQKLDVYVPAGATSAPVLLMVHGGAWVAGDKRSESVVPNKVSRWVPRGFIFVSVNYRLVPDANPLEQAQDVARALAFAQARASSWGADPAKFILMGHSAGAHLVDLLAADPRLALALRARPWLGTLSLDTAALDVTSIMIRHHERYYDVPFGSDPAFWRAVSPAELLSRSSTPMLLVCSTLREDHPCKEAKRFASRAASLGVRVEVLPEAMRHRQINLDAGRPGPYTQALEAFLGSLDPSVRERLGDLTP